MRLKRVVMLAVGLFSGCFLYADLLVEVDFAGTPGGVSTIAATDAQMFTHENLNYNDGTAIALVGGASGTAGWVYGSTETAVVNTDLHTGTTFGAPTRFDLNLGFADAGFSYSITNVEIVVRAAANGDKEWDFMYRDLSGTTHMVAGSTISAQTGSDPLSTYSIDVTSEGLTSTDSTTTWNTGGTGKLRFAFYAPDGTNNDNLQIDALRVYGQVVPEPATMGFIALAGLGTLVVRRFYT